MVIWVTSPFADSGVQESLNKEREYCLAYLKSGYKWKFIRPSYRHDIMSSLDSAPPIQNETSWGSSGKGYECISVCWLWNIHHSGRTSSLHAMEVPSHPGSQPPLYVKSRGNRFSLLVLAAWLECFLGLVIDCITSLWLLCASWCFTQGPRQFLIPEGHNLRQKLQGT